MNKRIFSVALALMLALASLSCAFATSSIQMANVTEATVTGVTSSTGAVLPSDFAIAATEATVVSNAVIAGINEAAATGDLSKYFGANTMATVAASVVGVDVSALKLDEAFPISVVNYSDAYGDVTVTLRLTKDYAAGDVIVALVGIVNADGTITWVPVEASVINGEVAVTFTQTLLDAAAGSELVFALLSE